MLTAAELDVSFRCRNVNDASTDVHIIQKLHLHVKVFTLIKLASLLPSDV